jgi:serine/threonine protein kinase
LIATGVAQPINVLNLKGCGVDFENLCQNLEGEDTRSAESMSLEPDPNIGRELGGRYRIVEYLGGGGFGQTYLAEDNHLPYNPQCVVKHLKPKLMGDISAVAAKRLFETEAQVLYRLGTNDRIPRLLAHFEENQEFYLVQECIVGENLSREFGTGRCWPEGQVIALLQEILEVLAFVHQQNVIHRDIKPSNLIRRKADGKIVLIDFGAVKQLGTQVVSISGHTNRTIAIGSPGYMPNEQLAGKPRFCSDIYAIGMIGIQALTGIHPKELPEDNATGEVLWRTYAKASSALGDILDKMVCYDFRQRYAQTADVLEDLSQIAFRFPASSYVYAPEPNSDLPLMTVIPTSQIFLDSERGIDYRELHDLLKAEKWQVADQETQRLMLAVCDHTERSRPGSGGGSRLTLDHIHQFPCRDLRTIDYLWMRYSGHRFGFTTQKQIWQTVGGSSGANYESLDLLGKSNRSGWKVNTPIERFGRRVGWRTKRHWIPYSNLSFDLAAADGHLPAWHLGAIGSGGQIAAWFDRLSQCLMD